MLDFTIDIELQNDRVLLRPLELSDVVAYVGFAEAEPDLWQYSPVQPNSPDRMTAYVEAALALRTAGTGYPFTVVDLATGKIAGSTRLYEYSAYHATTLLGYTWYGEDFRGTGLNAAAKALLLDWCFGELALERVGFEADATNVRSIRAMEKLGAVREGVLRSHRRMDSGRRRDTIVLGLLRGAYVA